jgi:hypothetical protein
MAAVAAVGYFVLADQRRSARILAATLTQTLQRQVEIDRVTDLGPSRVVLRGLRLPPEGGWPADVKAESVEASGPLLSAARGEAVPVRLVVTRPTVVVGGGGAAGVVALEGFRQSLASLLESPAPVDVSVTGGLLEVPEAVGQDMTFDATLQKASGELRGEILVRDQAGARLTLALAARPEGDTVRLDLSGQGGLGPLAPWLPAALVQSPRAAPLDVRANLGLSPGDRAAGRASAKLGDLATLEGALSFQDMQLRVAELRGTADLEIAGSVARLEGPAKGRAELADGEVIWTPERGGWPEARATLRLLDVAVPASALGLDARATDVETRLELTPRETGAAVKGDIRGRRVELAGLELASVSSPLRVDIGPSGAATRLELAGLTAEVLGAPVRGSVTYDTVRARVDAQLETATARLDPIARRLGAGWLGPSDQLQAGSARVTVTGLDPRGWSDGQVDAEVRGLTLRQPDGQVGVDHARVQASVRSGTTTVGIDAQRVQGTQPRFEGLLPRVEGSADIVREAVGPNLARGRLVARDGGGRDIFQVDVGRPGPGPGGPVHLTARIPALERLSTLWPSVPRQVTGSALVELRSPDAGFGTYEGRLTLKVPEAELLGGSASLRAVSAELPLRQGGTGPAAGSGPGGLLTVGELIGYGVVLYDVSGRARVADNRLTLDDLRYGLYSGQGQGTVDVALATGGLSAHARLTGEGVRIEEFVAAWGIRGGTMTGLMRYDLDMRYRDARFGADGRLSVPEGGTVTIELLDRFLSHADADPSGVVKRALGNLRAFDFKAAEMTVRTASDDVLVSLTLQGRERFGIFPPRVKEINIREMPLGFLARQFPAH